jgi:hypothetical protein
MFEATFRTDFAGRPTQRGERALAIETRLLESFFIGQLGVVSPSPCKRCGYDRRPSTDYPTQSGHVCGWCGTVRYSAGPTVRTWAM